MEQYEGKMSCCEDNIKSGIIVIEWEVLDWRNLVQFSDWWSGCCEHGNEYL